MHGSLFVLHVTCFCFCRFEARASHHNHTVCQFFLCWCWPVTSNNLRIIAWDWVMISLIDLWPIRYFNATLAASMQCRTLILPFIKKLGFTQQCLISNFPWLVVILSIFFRNPFYIIYLDKKHPIALACIANRVTDLFPLFFKCPRVRPCECGCIHEDTLFTLSRLVSFISSADGS
jgi:hypothetical protein